MVWQQATSAITLPPGGTAGLPIFSEVSGQWQFEYVRRKTSSNPGIIYTPQLSTTLSTWQTLAVSPILTSLDATWERATHVITSPPVGGRMFLRVQVESSP